MLYQKNSQKQSLTIESPKHSLELFGYIYFSLSIKFPHEAFHKMFDNWRKRYSSKFFSFNIYNIGKTLLSFCHNLHSQKNVMGRIDKFTRNFE